MGRKGKVLLMLVVVAAGAPSRAAVLSAPDKDGRVITVRTGTANGDCRAEGPRLVCTDGERVAVADLRGAGSCSKVEGGAGCDISLGPVDSPPAGDGGVVTPADTSIDVDCTTGAKKGYVYTLSDGDGQGACNLTYMGGRANGGTCMKGRFSCAEVNCEHGCTAVSLNCGCRIKSRPRETVTAAD